MTYLGSSLSTCGVVCGTTRRQDEIGEQLRSPIPSLTASTIVTLLRSAQGQSYWVDRLGHLSYLAPVPNTIP